MQTQYSEEEVSLLVKAAGLHRDMENQRGQTKLSLDRANEKEALADKKLNDLNQRELDLEVEYTKKNNKLIGKENKFLADQKKALNQIEKQRKQNEEDKKKNSEDAAYNESMRQNIAQDHEDIEAERDSLLEERKSMRKEKARINKRIERLNSQLQNAAAPIMARPEHADRLLSDKTKPWTEVWENWTKEEKQNKLNSFFKDDVFQMEEDDRDIEFNSILESGKYTEEEFEEFGNMYEEFFPFEEE